jgi:hypothetical protein
VVSKAPRRWSWIISIVCRWRFIFGKPLRGDWDYAFPGLKIEGQLADGEKCSKLAPLCGMASWRVGWFLWKRLPLMSDASSFRVYPLQEQRAEADTLNPEKNRTGSRRTVR